MGSDASLPFGDGQPTLSGGAARRRGRRFWAVLILAGCCVVIIFQQKPAPTKPSTAPALHTQHGVLHIDDTLYRARLDSLGPLQRSPADVPHPILALLESAKARWTAKVEAESRNFADAKIEYRRRYGRPPPRGFDVWWNWAKKSGVQLLDEYDFLYRAIEPYFALPPDVFRQRVRELTTGETRWSKDIVIISAQKGKLSLRNEVKAAHGRPKEMVSFLEDIAYLIPDMEIPMSFHDGPTITVTGPDAERHRAHARAHKLIPLHQVNETLAEPGYNGWPSICSADSPLRRQHGGVYSPDFEPISRRSYISDEHHSSTMDICQYPELIDQIGAFNINRNIKTDPYYPLFSYSRPYTGYAELPVAPPGQFNFQIGKDPEWSGKNGSRLNWRGSNTGLWCDRLTQWRTSQRFRLVARTNGMGGGTRVVRHTADDGTSLRYTEANVARLASKYYDVAFSGQPTQCDPPTCEAIERFYEYREAMEADETNRYKYIIDVDGNGWSGRFRRLMLTKSAILKSTVIPEWYADRIQPWYHYIPVRVDYQDLDDIMAFFTGDLDSRGAHDDAGRQIGEAGSVWAQQFWRKEDMQAYIFRLLLEYNRLLKRTEQDLTSMDLE